ncbi:hypothetical protein DRN72_02910, partial [Methanosarcinales archaeon]
MEREIQERREVIEREKTMISVLNEKPKQLCHQISIIRKKLMEKFSDYENDELKEIMLRLEDYEKHIALHVVKPEEGVKLTKEVIPLYKKMGEMMGGEGMENNIAIEAMMRRLEDIVNSYEMLMMMNRKENDDEPTNLEDVLNELKKHLSWASNRLKSHQNALEYWMN